MQAKQLVMTVLQAPIVAQVTRHVWHAHKVGHSVLYAQQMSNSQSHLLLLFMVTYWKYVLL